MGQMLLFEERIERISRFQVGELLPRSRCGARFITDSLGRRWVAKLKQPDSELIAEGLGLLLSQRLGVNTPQGAWVDEAGGRGWASAYVSNATPWDAQTLAYIQNIEQIGKMLALDAVILNGDRHKDNVLLRVRDELLIEVFSIDLGNAAIGDPLQLHPNDVPNTDFTIPPLDIPLDRSIEEAMSSLAQDCTMVAGGEVTEYVRDVSRFVPIDPQDAAVSAIVARLRNAPQIIEAYLEALRGRIQ